jgi:hypothetical protein
LEVGGEALDKTEFDHAVGQQGERPARMSIRRCAASSGDQMGFHFSGYLGPNGSARARLFIEGGFQTLIQETVAHIADRSFTTM